MKINDFKLEVYFEQYEFSAPYLLTQSDCESMELGQLLALEPGAQEKLMKSWLGYTEVQGNPELRSLVSALYQSIGEENVIMHTGAQEAIFDYMNVLLEKGDHVISMFPVYQSLYEVAHAEGCEVSRWELKAGEQGWAIDFDELEALIRPNTKLIAVNTPNNPTGYTFGEDEMKQLCSIAEKHGIYLFSDEVYRGLELDGNTRPCAADLYDKAASLGVMSKAYGLSGLRIGWVATKDTDMISKMKKFKHYMSICNSAPSEILSIIALNHGDKILQKNKSIIKENLTLADCFFEKYDSLFKNYRPISGPIAFHKMEIDRPIEDFCEDLVRKSGVLLLPANIYSYPGSFFRMGYGRKSFSESLNRFEQYLIEKGLV
ncbi:aminotransferase class I/II-fold pyridoxal phosphate-dependent enzyme [Anoxybacterium hadale]|uniref:Aminotransferase class I/II-fold pyridoxal phosphate-dependent enzyme n=1 Tax=Anoxybacterium hadale TaxID=3408580 RepID=A0ACD1AFY7_9FIRM|nr:aminotransferase class I/II-fold pyridoxal phosphate-dependent enzyme [Clostridiales bacterium]